MPRSGWLATGGVLAAIAVPTVAAGREAAVAAGLGSLLLALWLVLRGATRHRAVSLAAGAWLLAIRLAIVPAGALEPAPPPNDGPWTMLVEAVGSPREGRQVATVRLLEPPSSTTVTRLAATLPRYPEVMPGDTVTVDGRTRERPDSPYGEYLTRIGAWGTLQADSLAVIPATPGAAAQLEQLRRAAGEALTVVVPEPEAGLAAGILIGLRDRVDRGVATAFTTAGVSHIVAISGWNIAIVAAAVGAIAGRMGRRRRTVVTALAIAVYIAFAGASPSVLRAGAMAGVVLLARETGRSGRAAAALGWAALLLLLADPAFVSDAGFQLSTLATAGLIAWAGPTTERLDRLTGGRLPRWLSESLGVSLAAQLATMPIVLASFGRVALIAPAINLLVVPLVAPVMAAGIVALAGGLLVGAGAPAVVGSILAVPAWVGLRLMIVLVDGAAAVPYASLAVEPPIGAILGLGLCLVVGAVLAARARRRRPKRGAARSRQAPSPSAAPVHGTRSSPAPSGATHGSGASGRGRVGRLSVIGLVVVLACTTAIAASRPPGVARLTVLDVGQGDAILLEGAEGGRLLVDGGPDPDRLLVALDRRLPPWDRRIDVIILSHPHEDHVAGLALLLDRYRVAHVLEPGMQGPGPGYAAWERVLARPDAPSRDRVAAGDRLRVDDIRLEVRWPQPETVPLEPADDGTAINNVSVVLLGSVGDRRFLLTGDVEEEVDPSLLAAGLPTVDILKVAHHGSRTATTDAFLAAVRPRVAIASAGSDNPYGHPAAATIDRLTATGARVYRTDVDGTVTVTFQADGPVVRPDPRPSALVERPIVRGPATRAAGATPPAPSRRPYLCAIPGFGVPRAAPAPAATVADRRAAGALAAASPVPSEDGRPGDRGRTVGYHRRDDGPHPDRGGCPAALPGSPTLVHGARAGRRGGRRVAGGAGRRRGHRGRPAGDRDGRAAARHRQGAAGGRPGPDPPPRRGQRSVADPPGPSRAGATGRGPPGHPPGRRRGLPPLGRLRQSRGADRRLRRQARRSAAGVDGRPVRLLASALSRELGRRHLGGRRRPRPAARGGGVPGRRCSPLAGAPVPVDRRRAPGGRGEPDGTVMIAPVLYIWGDDDLVADRLVARFATALAAETGTPLERWEVRADQASVGAVVGQLQERLGTGVLFGGGTLAIVANPGVLVRRNDHRDRVLAAISTMAAGNAVVFVEEAKTGARGPGPRKLVDAVSAAGGRVLTAAAPRPTGLGAWVESEARERGLSLAPGTARELGERLGSRVTEGDVDRRYLSRIASIELDKLALRHLDAASPISPDDVRALVAETTPGSVWALTDAVGERRSDAALSALQRLLDTTPEPVLLAVLHRRVTELLELGDRLADGTELPAAARAMGITSEFRARTLAAQTRRWSTDELIGALAGLVELDAMVKGVAGFEAGAAQRRLAFVMWVRDHTAPGGTGRVTTRATGTTGATAERGKRRADPG